MISGSKLGSTGFFGVSSAASAPAAPASAAGAGAAAAAGASGAFTSASAISAHLHEERLFLGEDLRIGVVVQRDRLHRALAHADPAALASGRLDLGLLGLHVDDRHLVGADAHARQAGCALLCVDLGDDAAGLDHGLGEDGGGASRCRIRLADAFLDALGVVGGAAEEDALGGEVHWAQLDVRLEEEAVALQRHLEQLAELAAALGGDGRRGQHEQVERQLDVAAQIRVAVRDGDGAVGAHLRQAVVVVAREDDAELTRLRVVLLQQAEGADLLEPHVHGPVRILLFQSDGVLDALLAAGARAIGVALVERAGAEHEAGALDLGERRVVLAQHALEVHAADDLRALAQAVELGAVLARAGGHDDDAVVDGRALAVLLFDDAREVADEAVEVGELGLEVDAHVGVVDEAPLEGGDVVARVAALDGGADLEHVASELAAAFHEMGLMAHLTERVGGRHAGDAAADHDRGVRERHVDLEQRLEHAGAGDAHAHEVPRLARGLGRLVVVHPARLVADVGHLEEERVEPGLAQRVLEDRLVRARRAARHHDTVELVLDDLVADQREAVARARVHRVGGVLHAGQRQRVLGDVLDVDHASDVAAAVADEDAHARLLAGDVALGRVLLVHGERAARVGEAGHHLGRGGRGLRDRVRDVLGLAERADDEDALAARLQRVELLQLAEAVPVEGDADVAGRLLRLARRLQAGRQHHHVEAALVQLAAFVLPADQEVVGERVFLDVRGTRADEAHALVPGALVEGVEALALGAHVHQEDRRLGVGLVVDGEHRLLVGEHATDAGAVLVLLVARAHALDEGDFLGVRPVGRALDLAHRGAAGAEGALVLERREHIGVAPVAVLAFVSGVVEVEAGRHDHGADLDVQLLVALAVQQGAGAAGAHALHALGADGAVEAALGLGHGLLLGEAAVDLVPGDLARRARQVRHRHARHDRGPGEHVVLGLSLVHRVALDGEEVLAAQEVVDAARRATPRGDGLDGRPRGAGRGVAAGEHALLAGAERGLVGEDLALLDLDALAALEEVLDHALADGEDDGVAVELVLRAGDGDRRAPAAGVRVAERTGEELDFAGAAGGVGLDRRRHARAVEGDALVEALGELVVRGGDALVVLDAVDGDLLGAEAERGAPGVERHVAAADDDDVLAHVDLLAQRGGLEQAHGVEDALGVGAGDRQRAAALEADGEVHGLVAAAVLLHQAVDGEVRSGGLAALQVDAECEHPVDVLLQGGLGQAVLGDAEAQHAARHRLALEHGHGVAEQRQVAGGGEAAGAGADHGDLLLELDLGLLRHGHVGEGVIAHEALETGDGQRLVHFAARAVGLALVRADAAADGREGVRVAGHGVRLGVAAVGDQSQVALRAGVHGAGALAGAVAVLGDRVGVWDGLRVEFVDGLALAQFLVVAVGDHDGALGGAFAATGAEIGVDEARVVEHLGLEVPRLSFEAGELRIGDDVDVEVPAGLDQLRRQRAHRAVVGGEGLVELRHVAAKGRRLLDEVDLVPAFGQIERALDASDASAQHEGSAGGLGG